MTNERKISKEAFVEIMRVLEKHGRENDEINREISEIARRHNREEDIPSVGDGGLCADLVETLEKLMCDESEWISYYVWELDWGERNRKDCPDRFTVTAADGTDVPISTPEELYDCIVNI